MKKLPLTFVIPIKIDTDDRRRNFDVVMNYLIHHFDCPIIVKEADVKCNLNTHPLTKHERVTYMFEKLNEGEPFRRTTYINEMVDACSTTCFANYDIDVLFNPKTIENAVNKIINDTADVVYPFGDMEQDQVRFWSKPEDVDELISIIKDEEVTDKNLLLKMVESNLQEKIMSWSTRAGHCQIFRKSTFMDGFMENENFISWGPEDAERLMRFKRLGYRVEHMPGEKLIHLEHKTSIDSGEENPYFIRNENLLNHLNSLSDDEFKKYYEEVSYTKKYTSRNGDK